MRRGDDAWLPAATLGRVQSVVAAAGLLRVSTGDLAKDAGLGVSAFSRGFRGSTGWTPGDYLITLRMKRIATLLTTTDMPMTDIEREVGLASAAHAAHQFRLRHHVSVERFRSAARARQ